MLSILFADVSLGYLDSIERLINRVGFPVAVVVAIGLGLWRFCSWFGAKVAEPIVDRTTKGIDAHITFLQENTRATQVGAISVGQVLANQGRDSEKINDIHGVIVRSAGITQQQVSGIPVPLSVCPESQKKV